MIKYNFLNSPYNILINLHPYVEEKVFEEFLKPIFTEFFLSKGGIDNFQEFDYKKIKTEIEYKNELDFINNYLYNEIMTSICRMDDGRIYFKPKYSISFDSELADCGVRSNIFYPYKKIHKDTSISETEMRYGVMSLGETPVLYIIYIELQQLINFIKKINIIDFYSKML